MGKLAAEDIRGQIAATVAAERADGDDPGVRHSLDRSRDVLAAAFASKDEVMDAGRRQIEHAIIVGEQKAKISTGLIY